AAVDRETQPGDTTPAESLPPPRPKIRIKPKNQSTHIQPDMGSPAQPESVTVVPNSESGLGNSQLIRAAVPSTVKASDKKKPKSKAPTSTGQMSLFDL
ncbi:MAG TPA: hypothetical protein PKZ53_18875, partial [Acidobacteriota bacterium]|nr:hypothetical protein [Acidobacteriota bacterium]